MRTLLVTLCGSLVFAAAAAAAGTATGRSKTQNLASAALTVSKVGTGTGSVTSIPAGINCGTICSAQFPVGTSVLLIAKPAAGSTADGYSENCKPRYPPKLPPGPPLGPFCSVLLTHDSSVQAIFNLTSTPCLVPANRRRTLAMAEFSLELSSCAPGTITHAFSRKVRQGRVLSQYPRAGSQLEHRATVNLVVSKGRRRPKAGRAALHRFAPWAMNGAAILFGGTPATAVDLYAPEDVTFDAAGNVYISEFGTSKTTGHRVNEVDPAGNLRVVAGTGIEGYGGDGGPATLAQLDAPSGLLIDTTGALVVADHHNGCMRRVDASGVINAIVGYCGRQGYNGDGKFPALKTKFDDPIGIVEDSTGTMFVADEQNARVRRVTPDGVVSTILGGGKTPLPDAADGTLGTNIKMSHPSYLALDAAGNLYVSDFLWNQVVRIDPQGRVTHIAGAGEAGFGGDGGPATAALLDFPTGLALDARGRLYIDDSFNNRIRMVDSRGRISTVAGSGPIGYGAGSYSGEGGRGTAATLNAPSGIALSADGRLFIADQGNNVVRVLQPGGTIELFAGRPPSG